jgi:Mn-dependent DtxR family transcriptional regulator
MADILKGKEFIRKDSEGKIKLTDDTYAIVLALMEIRDALERLRAVMK